MYSNKFYDEQPPIIQLFLNFLEGCLPFHIDGKRLKNLYVYPNYFLVHINYANVN